MYLGRRKRELMRNFFGVHTLRIPPCDMVDSDTVSLDVGLAAQNAGIEDDVSNLRWGGHGMSVHVREYNARSVLLRNDSI